MCVFFFVYAHSSVGRGCEQAARHLMILIRNYYNSLPAKKVLIWGADESEGLEMAKAAPGWILWPPFYIFSDLFAKDIRRSTCFVMATFKPLAQFVHSRCALLLLVGKDAQAEPRLAGCCKIGILQSDQPGFLGCANVCQHVPTTLEILESPLFKNRWIGGGCHAHNENTICNCQGLDAFNHNANKINKQKPRDLLAKTTLSTAQPDQISPEIT